MPHTLRHRHGDRLGPRARLINDLAPHGRARPKTGADGIGRMDAAREAGVSRFHHISTCEVFGDLALDSAEKFTESELDALIEHHVNCLRRRENPVNN